METGQKPQPQTFDLVAGNVCLDFINTLDDRFSDHPKELLATYGDLVRFGVESRVIGSKEASQFVRRAHAAKDQGRAVLRKAIELREALHGVFSAVARHRRAEARSLSALNEFIQESAAHTKLVEKSESFQWQMDFTSSLESVVWAIARAAGELLASAQLQYVRMCSSPTCLWFFLDTSKSHQRRWCDMKLCGNREKARKFYKKRKNKSA